MSRRSVNLDIAMPRCRNCKRVWRPKDGVSADRGYCRKCSAERRAVAAAAFDLRPLPQAGLLGPYLLPSARDR